MWQSPPQSLTLPADEVHVWQANLRAGSQAAQAMPTKTLRALLSPDERTKADRFYFAKDRERFTVARGILRLILSDYLDQSPQSLQFHYSETGKPSLTRRSPDEQLCFNLSHSGQLALYAVAWNRPVGVDVEQMDADRDWAGVAARFFSPAEQLALNQLPPNLRLKGFFNAWTRKEAVLKATGQGLTIPLEQVEVSLNPNEPAQLIRTGWNPSEVTRWCIADLPISLEQVSLEQVSLEHGAPDSAPGYAAAVAAAGQTWRLVGWEFDGRRCV